MSSKNVSKLILLFLPLAIWAFMYYSLETYYRVTHNECGLVIQMLSVAAFAVCFSLGLKNRKSKGFLTYWIHPIEWIIETPGNGSP